MADTYPNEAFPSDASVALLDGTTDPLTGLPYIPKGVGPASEPSYEVQYNRRQHRANARLAGITEGLTVDEGSLNVGVYPFNYAFAGLHKRFEGATNQSIPDDTVRYVYVDASNALQIAASYPVDVSTFVPLAKVTASAGSLTIEPEIGRARVVVGPAVPRIGVTVAAETGDTIIVTLQLEDPSGNPLSRRWLGEVWLGDSAFGDLAATAPSGGVAVSTGQQLGADLVTDKHLKVISSSGGAIAIDVIDTGTPTYYLMAVGGGADLVASDAMTFAV